MKKDQKRNVIFFQLYHTEKNEMVALIDVYMPSATKN